MSPFSRRRFLQGAGASAGAALAGSLLSRVPVAEAATNAIVVENQNAPGTWGTQFQLASQDSSFNAFATRSSVDKGQSVDIKASHYGGAFMVSVELWRLGYYGGNGGRKVNTYGPFSITDPPAPTVNAQFGTYDRSAWPTIVTIPGSALAVSGVYLIKLISQSTPGNQTQLPLIVRDDGTARDALVVMPTNTWQAYNGWPGGSGTEAKSLYTSGSAGATVPTTATTRASKVSLNRPFVNIGSYYDWVLHTEFPLIYWLERNGYDVSYTEDSRVHADPAQLKSPNTRKTLVIAGHSEYWTSQMRDNVEAARNAGTSIVSLSANTGYWQVRYEDFAGPGAADNPRTLVCFKTIEGTGSTGSGVPATNDFGPGQTGRSTYPNDPMGNDHAQGGVGTNVDQPALATSTFRDQGVAPGGPDAPNDTTLRGNGRIIVNRPENKLFGVLYIGDDDSDSYPLQIPTAAVGSGELTDHPMWRFTDVYHASSQQEIDKPLLGWEWDAIPQSASPVYNALIDASLQSKLKRVSQTNIPPLAQGGNLLSYIQDYGRARAVNPPVGQSGNVHAVTYRADSGALVFASGSMQWSFGLGPHYRKLNPLGSTPPVWRYVVSGTYYDADARQDYSDVRIQQATCNMLFDTGVVPATPQSDLTVGPLPPPPNPPDPPSPPDNNKNNNQPNPPQPPPDTTKPNLGISRKAVRVDKSGKLVVRVSCPTDEAGAAATMYLNTEGKVRETPRAKPAQVMLGSRGFSITAGKTVEVSLRLSRKQRDMLARYKRLRAKVTVYARDRAGNRGTSEVVVTLIPPPAPKKKR